MNSKLESVLSKITALRALAKSAGTQAEAEAASGRAEALIAQYQIDEAEIEARGAARSESVREDVDPLYTGARLDGWLNVLVAGLARDHGCGVIAHREETMRIRIAGTPSDVAIVRYLFAWLHAEIGRLAQRERRGAARNAFLLGAANGVLSAMRKSRSTEVRAAMPSGGAMMTLANRADEALAHLKSAIGGKVTKSRRISASDRDALERGRAAGSNLAARPAMGAASGPRMLGS